MLSTVELYYFSPNRGERKRREKSFARELQRM